MCQGEVSCVSSLTHARGAAHGACGARVGRMPTHATRMMIFTHALAEHLADCARSMIPCITSQSYRAYQNERATKQSKLETRKKGRLSLTTIWDGFPNSRAGARWGRWGPHQRTAPPRLTLHCHLERAALEVQPGLAGTAGARQRTAPSPSLPTAPPPPPKQTHTPNCHLERALQPCAWRAPPPPRWQARPPRGHRRGCRRTWAGAFSGAQQVRGRPWRWGLRAGGRAPSTL